MFVVLKKGAMMNFVKNLLLMGLFSLLMPLSAMESNTSMSDVFMGYHEAKRLYFLVVGIYDACLSLNHGIINYNKSPSDKGLRMMNNRVKLMQGRIERIAALGVHDFDFVYYESARGLLSAATLFTVAFAEYSILAKLYESEFGSILPDSLGHDMEKMKQRVYLLQKGLGARKKGLEL